MATLVEVGTDQRWQLRERTSIGRDRRCDICVDDPMVSTSHAEIVRDVTGAYRLRDLGSRRGTFVGERQVDEVELHEGDELLIGPTRMRFHAFAAATTPLPVSPDHKREGIDELTRLRAIAELSRAIGVEHDLRKVLGRVLDACFQLLAADRGAIAIFQPHHTPSKTPIITIARERDGSESHFALSTTVVSVVMETHEPHLSAEIDADAALQRSASLGVHAVRSLMAAPLLYRADDVELLGVLQLDSRADINAFQSRDLELLAVIANQAALAVKNAMLVQQVKTAADDDWKHLERVLRDLPVGVIVLDRRCKCRIANTWVVSRAGLLGPIERGAQVATIAGVPCDQLSDQRIQVSVAGRSLEITTQRARDDGEMVVVVSDNTDELAQLTAAAHRDRLSLVGQLAGGIAHDFNNLLSVIVTYANMVEDSVDDNARADVQTIVRAATSASQLTRQLLLFSRHELVTPKVVDATALIKNLGRMLRRTLGERVELTTEVGDNVPYVLIDSSQLEQIVVNLVVNARDAIADAGHVQLRLSRAQLAAGDVAQLPPGTYALLEVADTGSGMAPEVQAHIFEPYFTTKGQTQGSGLGLATVHAIVNQAHGEIAVTSALGHGTTFRVYLPETERLPDADPRVARPLPAGHATVLVVDDDDDLRRMVERMLRRAGYHVLASSSGNEALAHAHSFTGEIDLLVTDMVMPGMTGQDLARELSAARPRMQVVFMSGFHPGAPIDPKRFVAKPFDRDTLLATIAETLAEAHGDDAS